MWGKELDHSEIGTSFYTKNSHKNVTFEDFRFINKLQNFSDDLIEKHSPVNLNITIPNAVKTINNFNYSFV